MEQKIHNAVCGTSTGKVFKTSASDVDACFCSCWGGGGLLTWRTFKSKSKRKRSLGLKLQLQMLMPVFVPAREDC